MTIFEASQRVSNILKNRFGCEVQFYYANSSEQDEQSQLIFDTLNRNSGAKFVITKNAILIPVYIDCDLFGCIEVIGNDLLNPKTYEDVHSLIDTTLRDFIIKTEELRRIKIKESELISKENKNVLPLFKNAEEKSSPFKFIPNGNESLKSALFIQGTDYSKMRELAIDIHSLMTRTSFLPYSVLEFKKSFAEEMQDLGRITIHIPELLDLPAFEIQEILFYLIQNENPSGPFLIISSQKSLAEMETESLIPEELIQILKKFHLEMNADFYEKKEKKIWEQPPSPEIH